MWIRLVTSCQIVELISVSHVERYFDCVGLGMWCCKHPIYPGPYRWPQYGLENGPKEVKPDSRVSLVWGLFRGRLAASDRRPQNGLSKWFRMWTRLPVRSCFPPYCTSGSMLCTSARHEFASHGQSLHMMTSYFFLYPLQCLL